MNTPSPRHFCPRCRASFEQPTNYCGRCGADMRHASGLEHAARADRAGTDSGAWDSPPGERWPGPRERRAGRDPWLGQIVDARYRVVEIVGRGGMGVVYKVEHQRMGKVAAMKVLHGDLAEDPEVVGRFRREAAAVSRLNHPNTVQVFDFGTTEGALYLIMEYVRGLDLGALIERDGPMAFSRAAPLIGQVCAALLEAHELGVVHRDLKPENVLVTRTHGGRDFVKVLDFGLAKLSERDVPEVTDRGSIVGTPYFMSPEQIRGEDVDARTDVYSLGALMYRLITGRHPFTAKTPVGVLTKHLTAELVPPSQRRPDLAIDGRVDAIVARAMAKELDERYSTIAELLADVEAAYAAEADGSGPVWMPGAAGGAGRAAVAPELDDAIDYGIDSDARLRRSDLDLFERSLRRRRSMLTIGAPLLLALVAGGAGYLAFLRPEPPRSHEQEPNDNFDEATLIAAGTEVGGHVGKRLGKREPDRDYFRLRERLAPDGSEVVSAHLTGLPNMDVVLSLYDATGKLLATSNEGGVAHDEWIHRLRTYGEIYVEVTQEMPGGPRLPVENVSDPYSLRVTIEPVGAGYEHEPNDSAADAVALRAGRPVSGYLDRRADVDVYRFGGEAGRYRLVVTGAEAVPLRWRVDGGEVRAEREAEVELGAGATIALERGDAELEPGLRLPGADQAYTLEVRGR